MDALRKTGLAPLLSAGVLLTSLSFSASSQEPSAAPPANVAPAKETPPPSAAETSFKASFVSELDATLSGLERECPAFFKRLKQEDKARLVSGLLSGMRSGVELLGPAGSEPPAAKEPEAPKAQPPACQTGVLIASNKVFYLRVSSLDHASVAKLKEECEAVSRLANKPVGIALDLRDCSGFDFKDALDELALFQPSDPAAQSSKAPTVFELPLAVLVGFKTSGSAEVLAALVERGRQGITVGGPTAGKPFPRKAVNCGPYLLSVPQVPDALFFLEPGPLAPAIEVSPYPQIPYEKLVSSLKSEDSDKCLSRAVDLLVSLDAIKRKWKR